MHYYQRLIFTLDRFVDPIAHEQIHRVEGRESRFPRIIEMICVATVRFNAVENQIVRIVEYVAQHTNGAGVLSLRLQ